MLTRAFLLLLVAFVPAIHAHAAVDGASEITSPTPGTLPSHRPTFRWTEGIGVTDRYLSVGTTAGGSEFYSGYQGGALQSTVYVNWTGPIHVRLMSYVDAGWQARDYVYAGYAFTDLPSPVILRPEITSPRPGSALASSTVTFEWLAGDYLAVGSTLGGSDYHGAYHSGYGQATVSGLPTDGSKVYVRLMAYRHGAWETSDYIYTAASAASAPSPEPSEIISPPPGTKLKSTNVTFGWTAGSAVRERYLEVTPAGAPPYGDYQGNALSRTVSGLPTEGQEVHVRLFSYLEGAWQVRDYYYQALGSDIGAAEIFEPANGSVLPSSTVTFRWTKGSYATLERYLTVGTTPGGSDVYAGYQGSRDVVSRTISGLPTDGRTLYVRLSSWILTSGYRDSGAWQSNDYTFVAAR